MRLILILLAIRLLWLAQLYFFDYKNFNIDPILTLLIVADDFDPSRDFWRYTTLTPKASEWDNWMRTFQQKIKEAKQEDWWAPMEEVFDLQSQLAALPPLDAGASTSTATSASTTDSSTTSS
jgi:hypothetical protein